MQTKYINTNSFAAIIFIKKKIERREKALLSYLFVVVINDENGYYL